MLIGLFTLFAMLLGGGPEEVFLAPDVVKNVKKHVADEERKKELLELLKEGKSEVKAFRKANSKAAKRIEKGIGEKDMQPAAIESLFEKALSNRKEFQASIIEKRLKMQSLITDEEWGTIIEPAVNPSDKAVKKDTKAVAKEDKDFIKNRDGIRDVIAEVSDDQRKQRIMEALATWETAFEELFETNQALSFASEEVLSNREATREDLQGLYGELDALRDNAYRSFNDFLGVVKANTTEDEWKSIRKKIQAVFKI